MRPTIARVVLLACAAGLLPVVSACGIGECGWNGEYSEEVSPGTYRAGLGAGGAGGSPAVPLPPSAFPHNGREVSLRVDRDAGKVFATWIDDNGEEVVETWKIVK